MKHSITLKTKIMKKTTLFFIAAIAFTALLITSCMEQTTKSEETELQAIFPKGEVGPDENFT